MTWKMKKTLVKLAISGALMAASTISFAAGSPGCQLGSDFQLGQTVKVRSIAYEVVAVGCNANGPITAIRPEGTGGVLGLTVGDSLNIKGKNYNFLARGRDGSGHGSTLLLQAAAS